MAFSQYFTNKTQGSKLTSDSDFISATVGDILEKTSGERYQKIDTNIYNKYEQVLVSQEDALKTYASIDKNNTFEGTNTFNNTTTLLQATVSNISHGTSTHTQIETPDLNVTHLGTVATLSCTDATIHGTCTSNALEANNATVAGNLTVANIIGTGSTTVNTLRTTGAAVVNNSLTANSITSNGAVTANGNLNVSGTANISSDVTLEKTLVSNGAILANGGITAGTISNPNVAPSSQGIGTIGDSTHYYNTVYATNFNGTALRTQAADLAEKYLTDKTYRAGTVLQFCSDESTPCEMEEFKDGVLAGVVSTKPGLLLNSSADDKYQYVALQGRVPVLCNGPIKKGQYCIADNGKVYGVNKSDITENLKCLIVGVALANSVNDMVEVKVF